MRTLSKTLNKPIEFIQVIRPSSQISFLLIQRYYTQKNAPVQNRFDNVLEPLRDQSNLSEVRITRKK